MTLELNLDADWHYISYFFFKLIIFHIMNEFKTELNEQPLWHSRESFVGWGKISKATLMWCIITQISVTKNPQYRYRWGHSKNIDIDKAILENIDIDRASPIHTFKASETKFKKV